MGSKRVGRGEEGGKSKRGEGGGKRSKSGSDGVREDTRGSQLTDLVGHFLQFVLRATDDYHIQPSSGQLELKQSSNHVCN